MSSTKIQFLVQMTCQACVDKVKDSLDNVDGIKNVDINLETGSVVVDSICPTLDLQERLESTGLKVAIKGYDGSIAAVAILGMGGPSVRGVVRFVQVKQDACVVDGTIDGLRPGMHHITVHECGDLSQGCQSVGDVYNSPYFNGDLGSVRAEKNGRAAFRFEKDKMRLSEAIGRSFLISRGSEIEQRWRVACGIIARFSIKAEAMWMRPLMDL